MTNRFYRILLVCGFLIVDLVVAELVIRPYYKYNPLELLAADTRVHPDTQLVFGFHPNDKFMGESDSSPYTVHINNLGFRNLTNVEIPKPQNVFRILMAGDSFTYGYGLTDTQTIPYLLEEKLNGVTSGKRKIEVINMGVPGYSVDQTYRQLGIYIPLLHPDMVIWNFISWDMGGLVNNTGKAYYRASLYDVKNNTLVPLDARFNKIYIRNALVLHAPQVLRRSYLYTLFVNQLFSTKLFSGIPDVSYQKRLEWSVEKLSLELSSMNLLTQKYGSMFMFVILPTQESMDSSFVSDYRYFISRLSGNILRSKVDIADLNKGTHVLGISTDSLFSPDGHPNATGSAVLSDILLSLLVPQL